MKHPIRSLSAVGAAVGLAAVAITAGGSSASAGPVTPAAKARPNQLFYDDFSGTALDRTKWNVVVQTRTYQIVNNEQ